MTTADIAALPVSQLAAPDCALLMWVISSDVNDSKLFQGFYDDHVFGKGCINCVSIYGKYQEFDNKNQAESLAKHLNAFDLRSFNVILAPTENEKNKAKELDDNIAWSSY